jgi:biopolymer transport protein ExbD
VYKGKLHRKNLFIDMTAMCDIAFLILAFFILTMKPQPSRPIHVYRPVAENGRVNDWGEDYGIVVIAPNKVMFEITDSTVRAKALTNIGSLYHIDFSNNEIKKFGKVHTIGIPIRDLKAYIDNYYNSSQFYAQPGIEIATKNNDLVNWIDQGRQASRSVLDRDLRIVIDADGSTPYPTIERVTDILNSLHIYKFSITYRYGKPFEK